MIVATTGQRIQQAMQIRGLKKQVDVIRRAQYLGLSEKYGRKLAKNALSQYIHDLAEPKREMIALLAELFDVEDSWLMGYDVPMQRNPAPLEGDGLDDLDKELLQMLKQMSRESKIALLAGLRSAQESKG